MGGKDGSKIYFNEDHFEITLKYKGSLDDLSSLQKLKYSYKTNSKNGDKTEEFTEAPSTVVFSTSGSSKGGAKVSKDEVIKVNVNWGEFEESLEHVGKKCSNI